MTDFKTPTDSKGYFSTSLSSFEKNKLYIPKKKSQKKPISDRFSLTRNYQNCIFCKENQEKLSLNYSKMISSKLYKKFSSSQNYYYTRDINDLLSNIQSSSVISLKDYQTYDEEDEFLKRYYKREDHNLKFEMLGDYYKFHFDIPRIFIYPLIDIVKKFHENKRRIDYLRITKMLEEEEKRGQNIVNKNEDNIFFKTKPNNFIKNRILENLSLSTKLSNSSFKDFSMKTIKDLNFKIAGEGKFNSKITENCFLDDNSKSFTNLENFLLYLKKKIPKKLFVKIFLRSLFLKNKF